MELDFSSSDIPSEYRDSSYSDSETEGEGYPFYYYEKGKNRTKYLKTTTILIFGLPRELCCEEILLQETFLGQYGAIKSIKVRSNKELWAEVSFYSPFSSSLALISLDRFVLDKESRLICGFKIASFEEGYTIDNVAMRNYTEGFQRIVELKSNEKAKNTSLRVAAEYLLRMKLDYNYSVFTIGKRFFPSPREAYRKAELLFPINKTFDLLIMEDPPEPFYPTIEQLSSIEKGDNELKRYKMYKDLNRGVKEQETLIPLHSIVQFKQMMLCVVPRDYYKHSQYRYVVGNLCRCHQCILNRNTELFKVASVFEEEQKSNNLQAGN